MKRKPETPTLRPLLSAAGLACAVAFATPAAAEPPRGGVTDEGRILFLEIQRVLSLEHQGEEIDLKYYFKSDDAHLRRLACRAAGRIGDPAARRLLQRRLDDDDPAVREAAAFALGEMGDEDARHALRRALRQDSPRVRALAAEALSKLGESEASGALGALADLLAEEGEEAVLERLLLTAWRLRPEDWTARVLPLTARPGPVGDAAVYFLMRRPHAEARTALAEILADAQASALRRSWAARALGGISHPGSLTALVGALEDPQPAVVIESLRAIARHPEGPGALRAGALWDTLARRQTHLHQAALETMAALASERSAQAPPLSVERLAALAALATGPVQEAGPALQALASLAPEMARALVLSVSLEADWRLRAGAADALARLPWEEVQAPARVFLEDDDSRVVWHALTALGTFLEDEDVPPTRRVIVATVARAALDHPDVVVRAVAADLLAGTGKARFEELAACYRRGLEDTLNDAALSCLEAAVRIGGPGEARDLLNEALGVADDTVLRAAAGRLYASSGFGAFPRDRVYPARPDLLDGPLEEALRSTSALASGRLLPGRAAVVLEGGVFVLELFPGDAPVTVRNFARLAESGYFDGLDFHRVVPNFVVQDGDPRGDGWGGPGWAIGDEINRHRYETGAVGMALSGPDTGGSQWFVALSPQPHLDGGYTVFGQVRSGMNFLRSAGVGTTIRRVVLDP